MNNEIIKEEMTPEEFEKARASGLVFNSQEEAKAAAQLYEMQLEEQLYFESKLLVNRIEKEWCEEELNAMTKEEREAFLEKERRDNLPENAYWRGLISHLFQQAESKRYNKRRADNLMAIANEKRMKKIEEQLTMKPATN